MRSSELAAALDGMLDADPDGLSDGELAQAMLELRRQQARLAAVVAEVTAAFDARQVHAEDGSRSAADWLAVRARLPRPQAAREVREARRLRAMPTARSALRAGALAPAHVRVLAGLAAHPRAGRHFPGGEANLVDMATELRFDDWQQLADHWLAAADPDGPERKRERDEDLRRFAVPVGLDGVGHPDGYLTRLATETVTDAMARIERDLFRADWAAAREVHGDDTTVAHLARTPAQRRHDALVEMAVRATTAPADGKRPAPLVTVVVDHATLAGRVCQLAGSGTVVAPGDIVELLGHDATLIERVVFDGANRVRDISSARSFRGILRRILEVSHRRCDHDTCFVPAKDCEGDHVVPWSEGGETSQRNGRLGCGFHNRWWYRHPERRPPPPNQLTADPPAGDAPAGDRPNEDRPSGWPHRPVSGDPPGDSRAGDRTHAAAGSGPLIDTARVLVDIADHPSGCQQCRAGAPSRASDLAVDDGDETYAVRLTAQAPSRAPHGDARVQHAHGLHGARLISGHAVITLDHRDVGRSDDVTAEVEPETAAIFGGDPSSVVFDVRQGDGRGDERRALGVGPRDARRPDPAQDALLRQPLEPPGWRAEWVQAIPGHPGGVRTQRFAAVAPASSRTMCGVRSARNTLMLAAPGCGPSSADKMAT